MNLSWLDPVREEFNDRLQSDRLAHALLLSGPSGTGKEGLAREIVARLLCLEAHEAACGRCRSCQLLNSGAHPDYRFLTIEVNENTGKLRNEIVIDQVRNLISSLQLTTTISQRKVALVIPADALNRNAANALLKTLEEPPGDTVILLVSHDPGRLPVTIRSRCQKLHVRAPDPTESLKWLLESGDYDRELAISALKACAGSPLRAKIMLEDGSTLQFREVTRTLAEVAGSREPGRAMAALSELEPQQLWNWLSLCAAEQLRQNITQKEKAMGLSELQSQADRNRYLLSTPVRKDLLLQDWLIQWSELKV